MRKILVVENDLGFRETVKAVLKRERYDVLLAKDAQEALDEIKKKPDLAVVDLRLLDDNDEKDLSGLGLIAKLPPKLPVVILSSNTASLPFQAVVNMSGGRISYLFKLDKAKEPADLPPKIAEMLNPMDAIRSPWYWLGWACFALSLIPLVFVAKGLWDRSFAQGVVSNLMVNVMWLAGGFLIRKTTNAY